MGSRTRALLKRGILGASLALLVSLAPALLVWSRGNVGRVHLGLAALCALALSALGAVLGASTRKGIWFALLLALGLSSTGLGFLACRYRQRADRVPDLWSALDFGRPELQQVGQLRARGEPALARAALGEHFRARPPLQVTTLASLKKEDIERSSDQLLASVYQFFDMEPVKLPRDLTWREDPQKDSTWQWSLHAMQFVVPLTERTKATGDPRYLQRARELILDWIDDNLLYLFRTPSPMCWHDHVTALRIRAWLPFWEEWTKSPDFDGAGMEKFLSAVLVHAGKLADARFYTEGHNHGLDQDIALTAVAAAFPELKASAGWLDLAAARFQEQLSETISPSGVHLEHSPGYHIFVLGILTEAAKFARQRQVPLGGAGLESTLRNMAQFAAYVIQPDGHVAPVGDSPAWPPLGMDHPILSTYAGSHPVLRYALTRGRDGTPGRNSAIYQPEGYALLRDSWRGPEDYDQGTYIFFTAAAHRGRAHKHADDLSFTLYALGRDWIVDSGHFSSNSGDEGRAYTTSARAHNVVLVDGEGFSGFDARMERHAVADGHVVIEASHDNYPGLRHRRTFLYVRPGRVFLLDEVGALDRPPDGTVRKGARDFEVLFHLAPELSAVADASGSSVTARPAGAASGPSLRIVALGEGKGSASILRGRERPLQGWVSRAYRKLEPAPVVSFKVRGEGATLATCVEVGERPEAAGEPAPSFDMDPGTGDITFRWTDGRGPRQAVISRRGSLSVRLEP